ncbi:MAG: RNA-binding domain-containing protein [Candidatus Geothermarchaeales archaeon]
MKGEISLFIHATEDEERIIASIFEVLRLNESENVFSFQRLTGHYGNPICYAKMNLSGKEVFKILGAILGALNPLDRDHLERNVEDFLDEKGNLHLRFNKQDLCLKRIALSYSGGVKISVKIKKENLLKLLRGE